MKKQAPPPNLRKEVIRAAVEADVDLSAVDRGIILGQIATLLTEHPRIGPNLAFKGGAIANLVDGSPRFSKDLDSHVVHARTRIKAQWVMEALTKGELARRVVKQVLDVRVVDKEGLKVPLIICHPRSGTDSVSVEFEITWSEPILLDPVIEAIEIPDGKTKRTVKLPVMARVERAAEKVATFVNRGLDRDAYDLFHWSDPDAARLSKQDRSLLEGLVSDKIELDADFAIDEDVPARFDASYERAQTDWGKKGDVIVGGDLPAWEVVGPRVHVFRSYVPNTKTGRQVTPRR